MVGVAANRSLGLGIAGDDGKAAFRQNFGRTCSPRTFGHAGAGGQIAWADPESGLSFVYFTNGLDTNLIRQARRGVALSSIAATAAPDPPSRPGRLRRDGDVEDDLGAVLAVVTDAVADVDLLAGAPRGAS